MGVVLKLDDVLAAVRADRTAGKRIVATNGCFDVLHVGHARVLHDSKALGDILVVGVNSDASVRDNKSPERPFYPEAERAEMLAALRSTDYVFIFNDRTPFAWISQLRPDIHTKGGGEDVRANPDFAEQKRVVEAAGGAFVLLTHHEGKSTSSIVEKIRTAHSKAPS